MQIIIDSFSDLKTTERGPSAKIKATNGDTFYVNENPTNLVGKTVDIEVTEKTSAKGNKYKIAKITKVHEGAAASNGNGKITWDAYRTMAEAAHALASKLEPDIEKHAGDATNDEVSWPSVDRSQARASIVNTTLSRYCEGKIFVPAEDDDMPF